MSTTLISFNTSTSSSFSYDATKFTFSALNLTLSSPYQTSNPKISQTTGIGMSAISAFSEGASYSGSDAIGYIVNISAVDYYWNGSAWVASNGSYAQSNTAATINTNLGHASLAALLGTGATVLFKAMLHSNDGSTTPTLTFVSVTYTFAAIKPAAPSNTIVYVWLKDVLGADLTSASSAVFACQYPDGFVYQSYVIGGSIPSSAFDVNGYAQLTLVETQTTGINVLFSISYQIGKTVKQIFFNPCQISNSGTVALTSITAVVSTSGSLSTPNTTAPASSFVNISTPAGTNPKASSPTDTLTFKSTDSTVTITGDLATNSVDLKIVSPVIISKGGTNSTTALNNNRVMKSSAGSIVEAAAITANKALASDASGIPVATATTDTELGYVSGVTSAIQTQLNAKASSTLTSAHLFVGNGSNVATDVAVTGDVSITNAGVTTVNTVGTSSAANIHAAELAANAATNLNTVSTIVKRDGSGNFVAGTVTAALTGTASGNTTYSANNHGVVVSGSANAMTVVAPDASTSKVLVSGGSSADPAWSLLANANLNGSAGITNANLATMNAHTYKGNNTGSSAAPADITSTQLTADLNNFAGDGGAGGTKGLVPAPSAGDGAAGKVLKADGTWGTAGTASPLTTKGDIYAYSTINDRLPVGTNGRVLIADSNQTIGLRYQDTFPKNYISVGSDAEVDTSGWATYFDAAANKPVDGTGGTATSLTFSRSTSSPLRGAGSFSMAQANSTSLQGKGVSYDFTIDAADKAKPLAISFDYNASSTFVASNGTTAPLNDGTTTTNAGNSDIEVFLYDVTNAVLIPVSPQVITGNGANNFQFKGTFQTASNSTSYRLIFHVATTSANATGWTFKFDNVYLGSQIVNYGSYIGDWTDESSSFAVNGIGTIANAKIFTKRDGDVLWVRGIYQNGTTAASTWSIQHPSKYVIDTSKFSTSTQGVKVGFGNLHSTTGNMVDGSSNQKTNMIFYDGSTTDRVFPTYLSTTSGYTKINGNDPGGSNSAYFTFEYSLPILGWASTTQLSSDTDTRAVTARVSGNAGSTTNNTPISFPTADFDTHGAYSAGRYTAPVSGYYKVHGFFTITVAGDVINLYKNASLDSQAGAADPNGNVAVSTAIKLVAGDIIDLRPGTTGTVAGGVITFEKLSGPSAIAATETVSMRYYSSSTGLSGSLATITYATKDWDTHGGYSSGTYTVPVGGKYQCNACIKPAATFTLNNTVIIELQKNGTVVTRDTVYAAAAVTDLNAAIADMVSCVAGDTLRIQVSCSGTSPSIASSNFENFFSLTRVGN